MCQKYLFTIFFPKELPFYVRSSKKIFDIINNIVFLQFVKSVSAHKYNNAKQLIIIVETENSILRINLSET